MHLAALHEDFCLNHLTIIDIYLLKWFDKVIPVIHYGGSVHILQEINSIAQVLPL